MAGLIVLSISMFILLAPAFESSIASAYPDDEDTATEMILQGDDDDDGMSKNLRIINKENVKEQDDDANTTAAGNDEDTEEQDVQDEDEEDAVALTNSDDELDADIESFKGCSLIAYAKTFHRGHTLRLKAENADFRKIYFKHLVKSIRVLGQCQWLIYEHVNFVGRSYLFYPGRYTRPRHWGGVVNQISSARVLPSIGTVAIVLFEHDNFHGRRLILYGNDQDLKKRNFNDIVSSFIITGGCWRLYKHPWFIGSGITRGRGSYSSPSSWKGRLFPGNDQISSVRRILRRRTRRLRC